jgi:hypothetical protein
MIKSINQSVSLKMVKIKFLIRIAYGSYEKAKINNYQVYLKA